MTYIFEKIIGSGLFASIGLVLMRWLRKIIFAPSIIFADCIASTHDTETGEIKYFVRYLNTGIKNLTECRRIAKLNINTEKLVERGGTYSTYLEVGDSDIVPVIHGTKDFSSKYESITVDISLSKLKEFTKADRYPSEIVKLAHDGTLTLDYLIKFFKEHCNDEKLTRISIELYIAGDDSSEGRLQFFRIYAGSDIADRDFEHKLPSFNCWKNMYSKFPCTKRKLRKKLSELR